MAQTPEILARFDQAASFDLQTGQMVRRYTHKGVRDDSTWARALAWAMVGYAVMYLWTQEREFLDVAMHAADWRLAHVPADRVAFWDLDAPAGPDTPRDTSGTAIAVAALLKLAALAPEETQRVRY
jgi:unsaturated chondroitin disaccharide hydrolase